MKLLVIQVFMSLRLSYSVCYLASCIDKEKRTSHLYEQIGVYKGWSCIVPLIC